MTDRDDFYVGYLPTPPSHRRAVRIAVPALLWLCAIVAGVAAWNQRDPGPAVWTALTDGQIQTWSGVYRHTPYPMLESTNDNGETTLRFIVRMGKLGAPDEYAEHDGRRVWVEGWLLSRQGREMIELAPDESLRVDLEQTDIVAVPPAEPVGEVTLRGEIVDSKCFLGAMKPGDGKGHRACATLCIDGGIPPSLITYEGDEHSGFHVLVTADGESAAELVRPHIAVPVEITGALERRAGLDVLRVAGITPISD